MNILQWNEEQIFTFFLIFIRVSSLLIFMPIFGERAVLPTVKALLCVSISWVLFPFIWNTGVRASMPIFSTASGLLVVIAKEVSFGAAVGYVCRWIFDASTFAGQLIATSMGLSMASVIDPSTESQTMALSEIKHILALLLFLAADGHLLLLKIVTASFDVVPLDRLDWFAQGGSMFKFLTTMTSEILSTAVKIAAPVVAVVFVVNITFGLVSKAVPQMNVFAVSFGANILVGLFVAFLTIPSFTNVISSALDSYAPMVLTFMGFFRG